MLELGELICGLLGVLVLRVFSGGRWQPGTNHFVEYVVGSLALLVLMMLVAGIWLLVVVFHNPPG